MNTSSLQMIRTEDIQIGKIYRLVAIDRVFAGESEYVIPLRFREDISVYISWDIKRSRERSMSKFDLQVSWEM